VLLANICSAIADLIIGYYITIPIFKQFPMKKLSNLVGQLWEVDPNKSLWSLLAKAWSAIRDQVGKDNAPLTDFFLIICPYLKVPSPETYLEDHGWMLKLNNEGSPVLCRDADAVPTATLSAGFADMTLSVEDITSICQTAGYAQNYVPKQDLTSSTFLGCSVNPTLKKSAQQPSTTQAVSTVQRMRVAARNHRRARRATAAALRQQIAIAHGADPNIPITAYETDVVDDEPEEPEEPEEPSEFYNNLTELLVGNAAQTEPENMEPPTENGADLDANSSEFSDIVNWGAFRPGADEGIYMPSFDEDQI
jgi:hypothetical protein